MVKGKKIFLLIAKNIVNISHLEMLLSYAYFLADKSHQVSLYISTSKDGVWGKSIIDFDEINKYNFPENIKLLASDTNIYNEEYLVYIGNFGHIGARNWLEARKFKQFQSFVRFDEGSGSWQDYLTLLKIGVEEQRNKGKPVLKYIVKKVISKLIGMVPVYGQENWQWFQGLDPNPFIVNYLPKVYQSKVTKYEMPFYENETWVILTGGFVESGYVSAEVYIEWLQDIVISIKKEENKVLIKPHPAEDLEKYKVFGEEVEVIRAKDSIDSLMWNKQYHHYRVIGEYSTSLVTLRVMYGIETFFVKSLVHRDMSGNFSKLSKKYVKSLEIT